MFPQQILTFHSWKIYTENSSVLLRFELHDPQRNEPKLNPKSKIYFLKENNKFNRSFFSSYQEI
jgi:hypothetical protein